MSAIAHFPGTVDSILADYERVTNEGGRLSDILSGYIDPDDDGAAAPQEVEPETPQTTAKRSPTTRTTTKKKSRIPRKKKATAGRIRSCARALRRGRRTARKPTRP